MSRLPAAPTALCMVQFVDVLCVTVVVAALPSMLADLHAGAGSAGPVVTGYAVCFGGLLMLGARLGDRYGHRRVLVGGLATFGGASLAAATAGSIGWLVAARCLQGIAAAASVPTALRLLSAGARDESARRRALAAWSAAGAAAGATGLLLGGVVTQVAGWRVIFWLLLPLALLLVVGVRRTVPPAPATRTSVDVAGGVLLTLAVMGVVLGCAALQDSDLPRAAAGLGVGVALSLALVVVERRASHPLLPAAAVRHPRLRLGAAASFVNTATTSSAVTLATLLLQESYGWKPSAAGLSLLPFSLLVIVGAAIATPAMRRVSVLGALAVGLVIIAGGDGVLAGSSDLPWLVPLGAGVAGLGLGLASVAATTTATDVPDALAGTAAGLLNTGAQLGTAIGVSVVVVVAAGSGPTAGWLLAAGLALVGGAVGLRSRRVRGCSP